MSIHDNPLIGPASLQQSQNATPAEVREHAHKFGQALQDIIERSEHLTLEPLGLQQAPLPFLAELPPAELDTDRNTMPAAAGSLPSDTVSALTAFYGQNSSSFAHILGIKSPVLKAMEDFPQSTPAFQSAVSALEVAILVDSINAQQAQAGARLGMISSKTAVTTDEIQQTSAASQYASGMAQAAQSQKQAESEITSGAISIGVGCVTAVLSVASMAQMGKAAMLESEVKPVTETAEIGGQSSNVAKNVGKATEDIKPAEGGAGDNADEAGETPEAREGEAKGGKIKGPDEPDDADGEDSPAAKDKPKTPEEQAKAAKEEKEVDSQKLKKAQAAAAKKIGERLKVAGDFMNAVGSGTATVASGEIKKASYTDQAAAAAQQQASSMQTAQAQYTNQFMDASSSAAKTSMDNAAQTAQASQSIKQAASQSASSIFRG